MNHRGLLALASLLLLLGSVATRAEEKAETPKIRVILIDGQNNHDWRTTTPILKKELESCGRFTVDVSSYLRKVDKPGKVEKTAPFPPELAKYDVVLSNYNGEPWPKEFQQALDDSLKEGKIALVIVHAANNSFEGWKEYNQMIGMGWRGNNFGARLTLDADGKEKHVDKGFGPGAGHGPKHPFQLVVRDRSHPITKDMPAEWMHASDELYHGMRGPVQNVTLLATAHSDKATGGTGEHEPMIWTVSYGKGRVFHTPMGHDAEAMRCYGFIATVQRGTEWAATGKVTVPLPKQFPSPEKVSLAPEK